ncbi:MAG: helix-turn-helix transcriptional regulator [Acidimicrobiales bacterium]|nr:helix-turn-helix transcriptional regulator [Acidimicrobiales bacterium]MCB9392253.1 helix-turn-helix transcriptional regulator [Acidimicrobiaceae bacterium]
MLRGHDLRRLRRRAGLTQRQVATAVGIPVTVLSAYERDRRQPAVDVVMRIVAALGYRIDLVPMLDPAVQARRLEDVLTLADALPYRPRPLLVPRR